jgi:hypothetical protein
MPLRWLPCEERCRDHLDGSRWTQALLDEIPLQELGYFLSMTPTTIMYNHLRRRIERGALTARFQSLAQGMLRTIEDILGSRPPAEDLLVSNKRPCAPQPVGVGPAVPVDMGWYFDDHKDSLGPRLDLCSLVRLTRVSRRAHAVYQGLVPPLLASVLSKNPFTRLLEAYMPERERFPKPDLYMPAIFVGCRSKMGVSASGIMEEDLRRVVNVNFLSINMWHKTPDTLIDTTFTINVGKRQCMGPYYWVSLDNMTPIMPYVTIVNRFQETHLIPTDLGSAQPRLELRSYQTCVLIRLFGRVWVGTRNIISDEERNCFLSFNATAEDEIITFVRDVIRAVHPAIAPSIPLRGRVRPAEEAGDGGSG